MRRAKSHEHLLPLFGEDELRGSPVRTAPAADNIIPIVIAISGAAGQIGYSLLPLICSGQMYGPKRSVSLRLLDIAQSMEVLRGVVMELEDAAYPLLGNVYVTSTASEAFSGADAVILLGGFPRRPGMERKDLIEKNTSIFASLGPALDGHAKRDAKIVVVANPANTNCKTLMTHAPGIPTENFSALMRLDHNRAAAMTARQVNLILRGDRPGRAQGMIEDSSRVSASAVENVIIWGNHSAKQFPDLNHAVVRLRSHRAAPARSILPSAWIENDFVSQVQHRGAKVMEARKMSSALSAAHAIAGHMRDWIFGTSAGSIVSMAILSDGQHYGVPAGLVFGFPVTCKNGKWEVVNDLYIDDRSRAKIDENIAELLEEQAAVDGVTKAS
eukprot:COSAG05_NODE_23_length_31591_cov_92.542995_24_plen_386_part_00